MQEACRSITSDVVLRQAQLPFPNPYPAPDEAVKGDSARTYIQMSTFQQLVHSSLFCPSSLGDAHLRNRPPGSKVIAIVPPFFPRHVSGLNPTEFADLLIFVSSRTDGFAPLKITFLLLHSLSLKMFSFLQQTTPQSNIRLW